MAEFVNSDSVPLLLAGPECAGAPFIVAAAADIMFGMVGQRMNENGQGTEIPVLHGDVKIRAQSLLSTKRGLYIMLRTM